MARTWVATRADTGVVAHDIDTPEAVNRRRGQRFDGVHTTHVGAHGQRLDQFGDPRGCSIKRALFHIGKHQRHPARANRSANARPISLPAPVTTATWPGFSCIERPLLALGESDQSCVAKGTPLARPE